MWKYVITSLRAKLCFGAFSFLVLLSWKTTEMASIGNTRYWLLPIALRVRMCISMHTHIVFYLGSQFLAAARKWQVISFSFLFVLSIMHWKRPWVTVPMDYQVLITQGDRKQLYSVSRLFTQQHIGSFTWNYALFTWNSFCPLLTSWRWYPASCPQQSIWESSRRGGNQCGGTVGPLRGIPGEETRAKAAPLPPELSYHPPPATVTPAAGGGEIKSLLVSLRCRPLQDWKGHHW